MSINSGKFDGLADDGDCCRHLVSWFFYGVFRVVCPEEGEGLLDDEGIEGYGYFGKLAADAVIVHYFLIMYVYKKV